MFRQHWQTMLIGTFNFSDSTSYLGVELRPWTFQWDLTLYLLIWIVSHINRSLHHWFFDQGHLVFSVSTHTCHQMSIGMSGLTSHSEKLKMTTTTLWMPKCSIKNWFLFIFSCLLLSMAFYISDHGTSRNISKNEPDMPSLITQLIRSSKHL